MQHVLTAQQFETGELGELFDRADYMRDHSQRLTDRRRLMASHSGMVVATMFYEPSTRTRMSFESAVSRLGMQVQSTENAAQFSSAAKGETIEDSTRVIAGYADMIVMRHKESGAATRAAAVSKVPIINAGDGTGEHPTQSLLDLYTIKHELGRLSGLNVLAMGDLKHGRTVRSLAQMVALYPDNTVTFVSPDAMRIGDDVKDFLDERKVAYRETDDMFSVLSDADVVYQTRVQAERHAMGGGEGIFGQDMRFVIGEHAMAAMKRDAILMHPLPRVNEIETSVDDDPRAAYFRQAENGLFVRMALLDVLADQVQ